MYDDSAIRRIGRKNGRFRIAVALFALLVSAVLLAVVNHVDGPEVGNASAGSVMSEVMHVAADRSAGAPVDALSDDTGLTATGACALVAICCLLLLAAIRTLVRRPTTPLVSRRGMPTVVTPARAATAPTPDLLLLSISRT